jgi:outer membrane immunogenic protein
LRLGAVMTRILLGVVGVSALLIAAPLSAVSAADMPLKAPPPPINNWTGFYLGIEGGLNVGDGKATDTALHLNETGTFGLAGGLFGGTIGYNWQIAPSWVLGAEGDISWTDKTGTGVDIPPFNPLFNNQFNEQWLATYRGRVGYLLTSDWLLYVTGGGAAASVQQNVFVGPPGPSISQTNTLWGWTVGTGVEGRIFGNWYAKVEYLFVSLTPSSYFNPAPVVPGATFVSGQAVHLVDDVIRFGINYKFDWMPAPVATKY